MEEMSLNEKAAFETGGSAAVCDDSGTLELNCSLVFSTIVPIELRIKTV